MKSNLVLEYIKKLIRHTINVYSIILWLLALATLATLLFTIDSLKKISLTGTGLFAILSFIPAGFYVWKETVEKISKVADLVVECESIKFGVGHWSGALPQSPLKFQIKLEFKNRGGEKAKLIKFQVTKCHLGTDLLEYSINVIKLYESSPNVTRKYISLPYDIPGRDWRFIDFEIPIELRQEDPKKFAELVKDLRDFEIELEYEYEDMNGDNYLRLLNIKESFEDFRQTVLQFWLRNNQHGLVYILKDIS